MPPLVQLKQLLARDAALREELHSQLQSLSGADWRAVVKDKTGIALSGDPKVTLMRQWFADWEAQENFNAELEQEELRLTQSGLSPAEVRERLITKAMARADAQGDSDTVLKAVTTAQKEEELSRKERELAVKQEALAQAERKLVLLEAKAAQANATEQTLDDASLTPEQREQRIKEIYGRA